MEQSALRVFEWIPETPYYSDAFHALYDAFRINASWSSCTLQQAREAVRKARNGTADDHFSQCLQEMFEKYKGRAAELIDYLDLKFDRSMVKEKFGKYEHICPMLKNTECVNKIIGSLLEPSLEDMVMVWRFEWNETLTDGSSVSMNMDPLRRFTALFDFFSKIEVMGERGESAIIIRIDFLHEAGSGDFRLALLEK